MSKRQFLLLSPCLNPYDDMENAILNTYVYKAFQNFYKTANVGFYNLLQDTPWQLYRTHCLYQENPQFKIEVNDIVKYSIFTFAITAIVTYLSSIVDCTVINANGPVMVEGFATIIGVLSACNRQILYWKDDVRRLWGGYDNPLTVGFLPSITNQLVNSISRLNYIDIRTPTTCGATYIEGMLYHMESNRIIDTATVLSAKITFLQQMGKVLHDNYLGSSGKTDRERYNVLKGTVLGFSKIAEFAKIFPEDAKFFASVR